MLVRHGRYDVMIGLGISIFFGILFTGFQLWEYSLATFSINDGIYGSIFYVSTGFHGLHVIIGTTALIVCLIRHICYHFHYGSSFRFWIFIMILTFCWYCMNSSILMYLLLRISLLIFNAHRFIRYLIYKLIKFYIFIY